MSKQELEALARRLDAEARKHTGDLQQADLLLSAKVVREAAKVVELMEGV